MLDISKELSDKYDLCIDGLSAYKDALIIHGSSCKRLLKKVYISTERVEFIHSAKEHIYSNGFQNLDRYILNKEGKPFTEIDGCTYVMGEMIEGKECNFLNKEDMVKASKALAYMHKASKGFKPGSNNLERDDLGKLPIYFSRRLEEIKKLKKLAKKGKSKFDYTFQKHVDYYFQLGDEALNKLYSSNYNSMCETAKGEGVLCHHDYTHNNIIILEKKDTNIINFEFCCFELKIYDLANLIRRKMRKCEWDIKEAELIINEYAKIEELKKEDFDVLGIMLQFPQKFWRVANKFYNSKRSWSEKIFVQKLDEVLDEIKPHSEFLIEYNKIY